MILRHATVFDGQQFTDNQFVMVEGGQITAIQADSAATHAGHGEVIDLGGDYLVPGLIDLQVYGGATEFLNETPTPATVRHIWHSHARNGTTTLLPTLHSTHLAEMQQAVEAVRVVRAEQPLNVPGIHLEGPYFNPVKRGAHRAEYIRVPDVTELDALFGPTANTIRILTLAPEMLSPDRLTQLVALARRSGTLLSVGHTNATYAQAMAAFGQNGPGQFRLATHLYNAMRGFESREPGTVGAVLDHSLVCSSLVADGFHCAAAAIRLAWRVLEPSRLFLISDALFANPPRPHFALDTFRVTYQPGTGQPGSPLHGRYVNEQGTLAGTAITLLDCVRFCVQQVGIPLADALRMATLTPATVLGMEHQIGRIAPGFPATMIRVGKALTLKGVWVAGGLLT